MIDLLALIASIIGLLDAGYLSYSKLNSLNLVCYARIGDCNSVNSSAWSTLFGIPVAYLGLLTYTVIILLLVFRNSKLLEDYFNYTFFGVTLMGFLFSIYLTYVEVAVLKTLCQWCLVSAIMMTILFSISVIKLARRPRQ